MPGCDPPSRSYTPRGLGITPGCSPAVMDSARSYGTTPIPCDLIVCLSGLPCGGSVVDQSRVKHPLLRNSPVNRKSCQFCGRFLNADSPRDGRSPRVSPGGSDRLCVQSMRSLPFDLHPPGRTHCPQPIHSSQICALTQPRSRTSVYPNIHPGLPVDKYSGSPVGWRCRFVSAEIPAGAHQCTARPAIQLRSGREPFIVQSVWRSPSRQT